MRTKQEILTAVNALPDFSRSVFWALTDGLYAEPGFSDVEGSDIARTLNCSAQAVGGAIAKLVDAGLAYAEDADVNGRPFGFLHTHAHDDGIEFDADDRR